MPAKKSLDVYVEQIFPVQCKGVDDKGKEVLARGVKVNVKIYKSPGSNMISSDVSNCEYSGGSHGEYCNAISIHLDGTEKALKGRPAQFPFCVYAFDVPKGE